MVRRGGCDICQEAAFGPDHYASAVHRKNTILLQYTKNKKKLRANKNGIIITCNVEPSTNVSLNNGKVKISVKPDTVVNIHFHIKNDTKKEKIVFASSVLGHSMLDFMIRDTNNYPITLGPKQVSNMSVSYTAKDVGLYQVPVFFSFGIEKDFHIIRELLVYVEQTPTTHTKTISPYADKEVTAKQLIGNSITERSGDKFRIKKNCKKLYANRLKVPENATQEEIVQYGKIINLLQSPMTANNYIDFFQELLWYEETIVRINLKKYNMTNVGMEFESTRAGNVYKLLVPGLAEKRPSLITGDLLFIKLTNNDELMFEAKIDDIQENIACLKGLHESFQRVFSAEARFDIRFFMCRVTFERMHSALVALRSVPQLPRLFPSENSRIPQIKHIDSFFNTNVGSNPEQMKAVSHIVAGTSGLAPYLVHGPPGTGKTVTIVEAILQLVKANPGNRILVCTDSNMAADHVASLLVGYADRFQDEVNAGTFLLRANSKYRIWETMPTCLRNFSNGTSRFNYSQTTIEKFVMYKIVITTLSHSAVYADLVRKKGWKQHMSHVFVDEAAQASEPGSVVPLVGLASSRASLVLAGDPRQLGPVCISRHAASLGLGVSLMERLMKLPMYSDERRDPNYIVMLRNNFRSHSDILQLPNAMFYDGMLRALAEVDPLSQVDVLSGRGGRALEFHGVLSKEQRMGKSPSYFNDMEVEVVLTYVTALLTQRNVMPADIGIVTPYLRQAYKIRRILKAKNLESIEVGSVEAFQGKEKRVIIMSVVRANSALLDHDAKFKLGFLVDDKRFNVAITRAKAKAIIIGNPLCLQHDVKWRALMMLCKELGSYRGCDINVVNNDVALSGIQHLMSNVQINNDN